MNTNGGNERFVPSGVDAQSWLGFEQRVQDRRFRALLNTMNHALAEGDAIEARVALEEARELRPASPELAEIEARLEALPKLPPPAAARGVTRARTLGAVLLLLVGITLLIGIDWVRSTEPADAALPEITSPELRIAVPVASPPSETQPVTIVPPPPATELDEPEPIATDGLERALRSQPPVLFAQPAFRQASTSSRSIPSGEIPDDFVFQPAARSRPVTAARQPLSVIGPPNEAPAAAADQTRVAAVLNQYARAYGQLDASAAREVWPSVNEPALARAFAGLASQDISFDACEIDVRGVTANASCHGRTSFVGKVGGTELRTEARTWRFELRRDGEAWKIENAEARRQ